MDKFFGNKERKYLFVILIVLLIFFVKLYYDNSYVLESSIEKEELKNVNSLTSQESETVEEKKSEKIYVHVAGRVKKPGLVVLESESRTIDAVNAAGGMYEDADIDNINLAKKLNDEDRVYIPAKGEIKNTSSNENKINKININIANEQELQNLPGVGEKTAKKIIEYREKNNFKTIEDIKNVSGFGEKKFEEIKDYIDVN